MKPFVLIAALTACGDGGRPAAPESTRADPAPAPSPVAGAVPAAVAGKFPEAAALGTGDRAVWIVANETGALVAWGRGPAAAETETTNLVNLSFRRRQGTPTAGELSRGREPPLEAKSRHGESPAPQPDGRR